MRLPKPRYNVIVDGTATLKQQSFTRSIANSYHRHMPARLFFAAPLPALPPSTHLHAGIDLWSVS